MSLPTGLRQRNGVWQLRIGVPTDLQHVHKGPDAFRGSLKTRDRAEAVTKAHALIAQHREAFDRQRAAEAVKRAPPVVPLTPEIEAYLRAEMHWLQMIFDDIVRLTPGASEALTPGLRFLTAGNPSPLATGDGSMKWKTLQRRVMQQAQALMAAGQLESVERSANLALQGLGVRVDWTETKARLALLQIGRAQVRGYREAMERGQGEMHDTPARPVPPDLPGASKAVLEPQGHTMTDVFQEWRKGKKKDAVNKTTRALALVKAAGINAPIEALTRQDGLTFRDFINTAMPDAKGKTRSDVLASIQALLNFAVKERGWINANPWAGTAIAKGRAQKRDAWDHYALAAVLSTPPTEDRRLDRPAQYWIPLLAVLTGARQAEICQLRPSDVIQRDGVWLLDINEEAGSVKSAAGVRWVAIHSKLVELGFLEHVELMKSTGQPLVFPGILTSKSRSASVYVSDWFRERCKALGIYQRYRDFHSLRTTVGTALRAFDPPIGEALVTAVMGHEAGNVGAASYHRPAPATLQRVIEALRFPAVMALRRAS